MSDPPLDGPFGSWTMDVMLSDIDHSKCRVVHNAGHGYVKILEEKYAIKIFHYGDILKELRMMLLAGPDCSIQVLGRLFDHRTHELIGFIMPYARPLGPNEAIAGDITLRPKLSKDEKKDIIDKLCRLMDRLQAKGIIHGDIKPQNLLLCSNGDVRLCDWAVSSIVGEETPPAAFTDRYSSPRRCTNTTECLTKAEDLYATGVTIWEIWLEEVPYADIDDAVVIDLVMAGMKPDLSRIDDAGIAAIIASYFDACPPPLVEYGLSRQQCTEVQVVYGCCVCTPPHSETRIVKCWCCTKDPDVVWEPCQKPVKMPMPHIDSTSVCPKCT